MANDLIQKNAELGRFLFCERYTLQPVKNALYIAEGQDLKRGAVVDVNGVLVGTNSLMPYAVLENDCDTRAKGAFASVFVKGEFNFDKLFFADGLSKEDLDNIVYSGSGIGLVIKPYNFSSGFSPKSDNKEMDYIKQLLTNPLNLPNKTIRCKFTSGYTPTMGTSQTLVDAGENIWDIVNNNNEWNGLFSSDTYIIAVIGANTRGVTNMSLMFSSCTSLTSVPLFDTSSVTDMSLMFRGCTSLTSVPLFDTSSVVQMYETFSGCTNVQSGALALYQQASAQVNPPYEHTGTFENCGSNTTTGAAELAQIPESWGGTAAG